MKASISVNKHSVIGKIEDRIYGSFVEHLGRCVSGYRWEDGTGDPGEQSH